MNKRYVQILVVVLAVLLSACTRTASSSPVATATPKTNFPKPVPTSGMNLIEVAGTQTAVATAGLPMPKATGNDAATPVQGIAPTFTPLAGAQAIVPTIDPALTAVNSPLPSPTGAVVPTLSSNTPLPQSTAAPIVKPATYELHEGEFPYCLARRYNINPEELLNLNGLDSNQSYYAPGTIVKIPQSAAVFPGQRSLLVHPVKYTVLAGDTIYKIACKFGDVDPMGIVSANNLTGNFALTAGASIQIP